MKSCIYQSETKKLILTESPKPVLGDSGAVIKVTACSICGTDIRTYRFGSAKIDDGRIVGHEVVGEIVELAKEYEGEFHIGDKVAMAPAIGCGECYSCKKGRTNMCDHLTTIGFQYDGGFAEYMAIPKQAFRMGNVYCIPNTDHDEIFALSEPLACAINAQSYLKIQPGDDVVIFGSGIIGCMHAELAFHANAGKVFIIETSPERIKEAEELLPNVIFLNPKETDVFEEVKNQTGGKGADVAIIACSVGSAQADGMKMLAKCGRISLFGGLPGESTGFIDSNLIHYKEIGVFGVHASTPKQNREAMEMIRSGNIDAGKYITKCFPLDEIEEAFREINTGSIMKAVIVNR